MNFAKKIFPIILVLTSITFAAIETRGTVADTAAAPIAQASVAFKDGSASTLTDEAGYFQFKTTKLMESQINSKALGLFLENGFIRFTLIQPMNLSIDIFDVGGRVLYTEKKDFLAGTHDLDTHKNLKIYGGLIVRISSTQINGIYRLNSKGESVLLKEATAADTLVVSKEGFITKEISIDGMDSIFITLDREPTSIITKYGGGSSSQTIEQGSAIIDFSFGFTNADSMYVEGLPAGIIAKYDAQNSRIWFSGTVTADTGAYTYTLHTVGKYTEVTRQGKITVTPKTTISFDIRNIPVDGYASIEGGTTGGGNVTPDTVTNLTEFRTAVQSSSPKIVVVKGTINTTDKTQGGDGYGLRIASNKTIVGADSSATIYGGLSISGASNVIIYNLNIQGTYPNSGPSDGIAVTGSSHHVFLSHLNIWDAEDGNLDVTNESNYVTVSYVKFWYTLSSHPHRLNSLIGSGASDHPKDFHKLKVTYHHCWFSTLVDQRMPRVMYGNAHVYNNYYTAEGNLYCVGVGSYGSALVENNYFKKVNNPIQFMYNVYTFILQRNNIFDNTNGTQDGTSEGKIYGERYITTDPYTLLENPDKLTSVPYTYKADAAKDIPTIVQKEAGPHHF